MNYDEPGNMDLSTKYRKQSLIRDLYDALKQEQATRLAVKADSL